MKYYKVSHQYTLRWYSEATAVVKQTRINGGTVQTGYRWQNFLSLWVLFILETQTVVSKIEVYT